MGGHHLILGELSDYLTGETLQDTHDERYRQAIARELVENKGYDSAEITACVPLTLKAGEKCARIHVDFLIRLGERIAMLIKYAPGSLVTRHRPVLAMSRLVAPYGVPVAVVTNGEDADVLDTKTGKGVGAGFAAIPDRESLLNQARDWEFPLISEKQAEMESRIAFAFEIDNACPCDDTVCRL